MPTRPPTHTAILRQRNPAAYARADRSTRKAFYGSAKWQRFRDRKLADNPLCEDCLERGETTASREVHHMVKLATDLSFAHATSDEHTRALCSPCHSARTKRGE
jgi:5-methylcytosine-specific restriction protein A